MTKDTGRGIGFVTAKQFREIEGEDAKILPAVSAESEWQKKEREHRVPREEEP